MSHRIAYREPMRRPVTAAACTVLALCLAATPAAASAPPKSFYGVVPQADLATADFERMQAGRVGTIRETMGWSEIDQTPLPGDLDWADFDFIVANAARRDIDVLPTVYTTPTWVSRIEGCDGPIGSGCGLTAPTTVVGLAAWRSFLGSAVRRYGPDGVFWDEHPELPRRPITEWQIWNEPNSPGFYKPAPSPRDYANLVVAAGEAIHGQDPDARVVLGGMYGNPTGPGSKVISASEFLGRLYERPGFATQFDGVAVHPYSGRIGGVKAQVRKLVNASRSAGDNGVAFYVTELGWASGGDRDARILGRRGQARRLEQAFRYLTKIRERINLRLVSWFAWRDIPVEDSARCYFCPQSGLFPVDSLTPKPAWDVFTRFTHRR